MAEEKQVLTAEIAVNDLANGLAALKVEYNIHVQLRERLQFLLIKANEADILKKKVEDMEVLLAAKKKK